MGSGVGVMGPIIKHVILPSFVFALACIGLYFAIKSVDHKSLANSLTNALTNLAAALLAAFHLQVYQFLL